MAPIQVFLLLDQLLSFLKRLRIVSDKLWKLGIGKVPLLRSFFRKCLTVFIGCFRIVNQTPKSSESRPSTPWDKANHDWHGPSDNVDCFSKLPKQFWSGWPKRSQSLPLHRVEHCNQPEQQMDPSISQAVVPYSVTPTKDTGMSRRTTGSSVTIRAEDDLTCHDPLLPPGLSNEILTLSDGDLRLVGVTSSEFERYERGFKSEKVDLGSFPIHPLHMTFTELELPNRWAAFAHPDGARYFFDNSQAIPILTDVWMYDPASSDRLEAYINQIFSYINKYQIEIPVQACLVLEFRNTGKCGYYFVNHAKQCLFWLDEFNGMDFLFEVKVKYTLSHIGHEMKSLYWLHNHLFPNAHPLPSNAISEIKDILIHAVGDSLTSVQGLAPYSLEDLRKMLELVNTIQVQDELGAGSVAIISRFLQNFYHERFLHLHGQKLARLNRDQSIHPDRPRTILMTVVSPFLLYGPEFYLRKLREITLDCLVNNPVWTDLLRKLMADWKDFTLYATVLLNANVAFLAIQSVDSSTATGHRSNAQRASYVSTVTSVGAIVLGLLLVRNHNSSLSLSFVVNRSASRYGLEILALMYSLPYALLMWGMISFLVAFSIACFGSHDKVTIVVMAITWVTLCSLLLWCISMSYNTQPFWYPGPWPFRQWRRTKDWIKKLIMDLKAHKDKLTSELPRFQSSMTSTPDIV